MFLLLRCHLNHHYALTPVRFKNLAFDDIDNGQAREYTRALTSVKLDKMFAKPLVGALDGHGDGVFCSATSRRSLVQFLSGTQDELEMTLGYGGTLSKGLHVCSTYNAVSTRFTVPDRCVVDMVHRKRSAVPYTEMRRRLPWKFRNMFRNPGVGPRGHFAVDRRPLELV